MTNSLATDAETDAIGFEAFENLARRDPRLGLARSALNVTWLGPLLPAPWDARAAAWMAGRRLLGSEDLRGLMLGDSPGAATRDRALAFLERLVAQPAPYFLFLHFADLHQPYRPDPTTRGSRTAGRGLPPPFDRFRPDSPGVAEAIEAGLRRGDASAAAAAELLHDTYLEELEFLDRCLGAVLDAVESSRRPTWILLTANHGEQFGEGGRMGHGNSLHEVLLRVPLWLSGPGLAAGVWTREPRLEDVAPTLLARCGLQPPPACDGVDLLAGTRDAPPYLASNARAVALYAEGWKLLLEGAPAAATQLRPRALYRLEEDPEATRDLASAEPQRVSRLAEIARRLLREQLARAGEVSD